MTPKHIKLVLKSSLSESSPSDSSDTNDTSTAIQTQRNTYRPIKLTIRDDITDYCIQERRQCARRKVAHGHSAYQPPKSPPYGFDVHVETLSTWLEQKFHPHFSIRTLFSYTLRLQRSTANVRIGESLKYGFQC